MEILSQSTCFSTVKKLGKDELLGECFFISTGFEAVGRLRVDVKSFLIKSASWDIYRSPGGRCNGGRELPELEGVEAYFNAGGALRRAAGEEGEGLPRELLAECVRGIIQAETYVFTERGHASSQAYEDTWVKLYKGSCRFYSHLDRVTRRWYEHVGNPVRDRCLYNRSKSCAVFRQTGGGLVATGAFSDSFHELGLYATLDNGGEIISCTGNYLRAPDAVCFENKAHLTALTGKNLANLSKKAVAEACGGPQGCNHLVDLLHDMAKTLSAAYTV